MTIDEILGDMGYSQEDWDIYKRAVAGIETKGYEFDDSYSAQGGASDHYDGRYQLGRDAKTDASGILGVPDPGHTSTAREAFRGDPSMQEDYFAAFTNANYKYLMKNNPKFRNASARDQMGMLGYAHNQGMGGASNWIKTGEVGADAFKTKGTVYTDAIKDAFDNLPRKDQFGFGTDWAPASTTDWAPASTTNVALPFEFGLGTGVTNDPIEILGEQPQPQPRVGYEASYTDAVAKEWEGKGGKDAYIKAAKAWRAKNRG